MLEHALAPVIDGGIHHVGSTAVPGIAAKPIIDVMVGVRSLEAAREYFDALAQLEYHYWPYQSWMHWFCKPSPAARTYHLHLVEPGHPEFAGRLAFRDYLRADRLTAAAYEDLKSRLAKQHRDDRDAYTRAKGEFVRAVVARALTNTAES